MKKILGLVGAVFFSAVSFGATAATITRECDSCSIQEMDSLAYDYSLGLVMPSDNILYVLNPTGDISRKYQVMRDWEGGAICEKMPPGAVECQPFSIVDSLPVESEVGEFLHYRRIVLAAGSIVIAEPGYPTNAFDDIQNPQKREKIDEYLRARFEAYTYLANGAYSLGINVFSPLG